ncbi:MAG TPA: GWxTD domain-containing protein [Cyclobacteriaceae bacterium]
MRLRRWLFLFAIASTPGVAAGQALQDINYSYLYQIDGPFQFRMAPVKTNEGWTVSYSLKVREENALADYQIQWELRDDLKDKEGTALRSDSTVSVENVRGPSSIDGTIRLAATTKGVLNARVIHQGRRQVWNYPLLLREDHPVDITVRQDNQPLWEKYLTADASVSVAGTQNSLTVSLYTDEFPPAAPPFSEALARVSPVIRPDSVFRITSGETQRLSATGLYLIQGDTTTGKGIAFRVHDDYPKYTRLENLVDPLTYICTRQEIERLKSSRGDKRQFDRTILNITGNSERAKNFMRSYFRRVEEANQLFTSYKEGWKTDRGMVYIILGRPEEVYRFEDREVWSYNSSYFKGTLSFVRSPTLFDPENFVLIRQKKFTTDWYEVIDLWRNSRF